MRARTPRQRGDSRVKMPWVLRAWFRLEFAAAVMLSVSSDSIPAGWPCHLAATRTKDLAATVAKRIHSGTGRVQSFDFDLECLRKRAALHPRYPFWPTLVRSQVATDETADRRLAHSVGQGPEKKFTRHISSYSVMRENRWFKQCTGRVRNTQA